MTEASAIAREALAALDSARQIEPFTARDPGFDTGQAYAVTATLRALREGRGEKPVGRKIGFTNRDLWAQYKIDCPIWGDMYAHTVRPIALDETLTLAPFCEPQIEPELVLRLSRAPEAGMDEYALMDCIEWVAHGFEIVQSIFPHWRFQVADTIAGFGMHGALRIGAPLVVTAARRDALISELKDCTVSLARDGTELEAGRGSNVLGGPLSALRALVDLLVGNSLNPRVSAGEIITTGTLTRAYPVRPGETWTTRISGIPLAGLSIRFG